MKYSVSKGQYVSKGLKRFDITITDEFGSTVYTGSVVGNKKTATNKIEKLKKEYRVEHEG